MTMLMLRALTLLLLTGVLASACATRDPSTTSTTPSSPPASTARAKRITLAVTGEPTGYVARMTPTQNSIPGASVLEQLVNGALAEEAPDHSLQPLLAEAVPTLENGLWVLLPDGRMELTWKIRDGATWQDGIPLTSDDLVFTTAVDQNKDVAILRAAGYSWVQGVEAVDPRTIRVTWTQPYIGAERMFTQGFATPLPRHLLESAVANDPAHLLTHPYWVQEYVGAGPFIPRRWMPGESIFLEANGAYVLGRPRIDEIEMRFISDLNALMANLIAGSIDINLGRGLTIEQAIELRSRWPDGRMDLEPSSWINVMPQYLNPRPAVVADVNFRRALLYGTDRQELVDTLQGGLSSIADVYIGPQYREHAEVASSLIKYPYDPRRAAQLIESLGYRKGADGTYRDASGTVLAVELRSNGSAITEKTIVAVANLWSRLGVATDPEAVPQPQMVDREYVATFPGFRMTRQGNEPDSVARWHSRQTPLPENRFVGPNYSRYNNAEWDALIDRYAVTIPWDERMQVLRRITQYMTDYAVILGMFYDPNPTFLTRSLINITAGDGNVRDAHLWDLTR
jgi:peptide/nickel transport system substrate-binding protein